MLTSSRKPPLVFVCCSDWGMVLACYTQAGAQHLQVPTPSVTVGTETTVRPADSHSESFGARRQLLEERQDSALEQQSRPLLGSYAITRRSSRALMLPWA